MQQVNEQLHPIMKVIHHAPMLSMLIVACLSITACMQSLSAVSQPFAAPERAELRVSDNTIKTVNKVFYASFMGHEWHYQGARQVHGGVNAYIRIPRKLEMDLSVQKTYIKTAICPSVEETSLWKNLNGVPLSVHIYTVSQKHSVYATCSNPTV